MTLQQFKQANFHQLRVKWVESEYKNFANFESYVWYEWQQTGDCVYEDFGL